MRTSFQAATIVVVAGLALAGCGRKTGAPAPAAAGPETVTAADTIYAGGDIVTVDDAQPGVEALAVKDGRILAVGPRADIEKAHKGAATRMVDLGGKTLLPDSSTPTVTTSTRCWWPTRRSCMRRLPALARTSTASSPR